MSRTYREFGDLLSAYNEADEKWTPIQKAHELLDSVNENEIWEQRHAAADALFTYIAELEAEVTKGHELQDSYCDRIAELEHDLTNKEIEYTDLWDDALAFQSRIAELSQAVGLITTLKPTMVMDANHPLDMVREVAEHVTARIAELEAENAGLKERVAMLDVNSVYKSLGEMGYIEQTNRLHTSIAESESTIEQLIEAGKGLLDSLCTDPEEEKTVEVMNWKAVVDKVNKERER